MFSRLKNAALLTAVTAGCVFSQELPNKIKGYKLFDPPIAIRISDGKSAAVGPKMAIVEVRFGSIGLTGLNLTSDATVTDAGVSATVDFMTFRDFHLNGMAVQIADYRDAFKLTERGTIALKAPLELFIPIETAAKTAFKEILETRSKWSVTGTALVFGRFRRFGFTFKRVVPIRVDISIDNPLPRI